MKNLLLFLFVALGHILFSQHQLQWLNRPAVSNGQDVYINDMITDEGGDIYIKNHTGIGTTIDSQWIVKIDAHGIKRWETLISAHHFPEENQHELLCLSNGYLYTPTIDNGVLSVHKINMITGSRSVSYTTIFPSMQNSIFGYALTLHKTPDGHIYIATTVSGQASSDFIAELDGDGNLIKTFSPPTMLAWSTCDRAIGTDSSGNLYCAYYVNTGNNKGAHLLKYNATGAVVMDTIIGSSYGGIATFDDQGNTYLRDTALHGITKFDSLYRYQWQYSTGNRVIEITQATNDGDVYILAGTNSTNPYSYYLTRLNKFGNVLFNKRIPNWEFVYFRFHVNGAKQTFITAYHANNYPYNGQGYLNKFQVARIIVVDPDGTISENLSDAVRYSVYDDSRDTKFTVDGDNNVIFAYAFKNKKVLELNPFPMDSLPYMMWYTAKYTTGVKKNITGTITVDAQNNCLPDSGEYEAESVMVQLNPNSRFAFTDSKGKYGFSTGDTGIFTVSVIRPENFSENCQPDTSVIISQSHPYAVANFVVTADTDCSAYLNIASERVRWGIEHGVSLNYQNTGSMALTGLIALELDPGFFYLDASPRHDSVSGNTFFWRYINLAPLRQKQIDINLITYSTGIESFKHRAYALSSCNNGMVLCADSLADIVFNSYDPNDKQLFPLALRETNSFNSPMQKLSYQINFQNTGNDTAYNIAIRDTLSNLLDLPSFKMIASSHPCEVSLSGEGALEWKFKNIYLPDSNTNERLSHGYVKYSITPKPSIAANDLVVNRAAIYFDFNDPIFTNTLSTQYVIPLSVEQPKPSTCFLYPNPTNGKFMLLHKNLQKLIITITDIQGRQIKTVKSLGQQEETQLDAADLNAGVYFVSVTQQQGNFNYVQKLIKF